MSRNSLTSVHGELSDLPRLRSVIVRHNNVSYFFYFLDYIIFGHSTLSTVESAFEISTDIWRTSLVNTAEIHNLNTVSKTRYGRFTRLFHSVLFNEMRSKSKCVNRKAVKFTLSFQIKTSGIPTDIFRMKDLTIIDFSNNQLREVLLWINWLISLEVLRLC